MKRPPALCLFLLLFLTPILKANEQPIILRDVTLIEADAEELVTLIAQAAEAQYGNQITIEWEDEWLKDENASIPLFIQELEARDLFEPLRHSCKIIVRINGNTLTVTRDPREGLPFTTVKLDPDKLIQLATYYAAHPPSDLDPTDPEVQQLALYDLFIRGEFFYEELGEEKPLSPHEFKLRAPYEFVMSDGSLSLCAEPYWHMRAMQVIEPFSQAKEQTRNAEEELEDLLSAIKIPQVSYSEIPLSEVINDLYQKAKAHRPEEHKSTKLNFIYINTLYDPPLTITLRNFSLDKILEFSTKSVGFKYSLSGNSILISGFGYYDNCLETILYEVEEEFLPMIAGLDDWGSLSTHELEQHITQRFWQYTPNATCFYDGVGTLYVRTTIRGHYRFAYLLKHVFKGEPVIPETNSYVEALKHYRTDLALNVSTTEALHEALSNVLYPPLRRATPDVRRVTTSIRAYLINIDASGSSLELF